MAVSETKDLTNNFNASGSVKLDIGGWDYAILHIVTPSGTVNFKTSNDGGWVNGVSDGGASASTNYLAVQGTNLTTTTQASSTAASGIFRFDHIGGFFQIDGAGVTCVKAIIRLFKIN
jgi:hypothetical protein